jgi:NADH dehydrogenase
LEAAKAFRGAPVQVTLVDKTNHHLFQPLLYQVATAALSPGEIAKPIRSILRRSKNLVVVLGEAQRVDVDGGLLHLAGGSSLSYDYLILAPGTRHSYFAHPEWESLAPGLKTVEDALEVRRRILLGFERAEREPDPVERQRHLTFVVIGGGPTGVEVAGAIAEIKRFALARDFRRIDPRDAAVVLLEGGKRLLPGYPPKLSQRAKEKLRRLGVEVRTETLVTGVEPGAVIAGGWRIPTDTVVWAAGNIAHPLLQTLGVPLDRVGRVVVEPDCSIPGHPELFVLGDAAAYCHQEGTDLLPGVCQTAMQMGRHAAKSILGDLANRPRSKFHYRDKGQLAVIGRGQAVADFGRFHLSGFLAWFTWIFIHIFYLIGFPNRILVLVQWAWSYLTFERGARLITSDWQPGSPAEHS